MPKGYWIVHSLVSDPQSYQDYIDANRETMMAHGAQYLVRGGKCEVVEGQGKPRNVIVEFADYETALKCWHSVGYQQARQKREGAAQVDITVIEGA